ncbi:hypothetical protein EYF80_033456 [Liparis tanakae]|uniref:Uncharacterized protein n=1 Tax=Liparis tanakae TaxID=230148 RepID=A0A4Z2GTB9_9TELE|nr:hypothetical protein EYF80_033456 [Liparis tanakae]
MEFKPPGAERSTALVLRPESSVTPSFKASPNTPLLLETHSLHAGFPANRGCQRQRREKEEEEEGEREREREHLTGDACIHRFYRAAGCPGDEPPVNHVVGGAGGDDVQEEHLHSRGGNYSAYEYMSVIDAARVRATGPEGLLGQDTPPCSSRGATLSSCYRSIAELLQESREVEELKEVKEMEMEEVEEVEEVEAVEEGLEEHQHFIL